MPAWYSTSDGQAATGEIEREIKTRGWDLLIRVSSKDQLDIGQDQRRKCITHLQCQYPDAQKDTAAWLKFINKITGQAKQWKSASTAYTQAANQTHNLTNNLAISDSQFKRKAGQGLSQDARKEQGLELTPDKKARGAASQCAVCVYSRDGSRVCVVQVLVTIVTGCTGTL